MNDISKKTNLVAIFFTLFMFTFVLVGYFIEVINGNRSPLVIGFLLGILLLNFISVFMIYKKNPSSNKIAYILILGFLIPYGYTLLTTESIIAFAFIVPIFMISFMFFEKRLVTVLSVSVFLMNIYFVRKMIISESYSEGSTDLLLTISILLTLIIASVFVGYTNDKVVKKIKNMLDNEKTHLKEKELIMKEIESVALTLLKASKELSLTSKEGRLVAEEMAKAIEDIANGVSNQAEDVKSTL